MTPLLQVQNLHAGYRSRAGKRFPALEGVSFDVWPGETLGILGESGSGKSTLASSLLRLLPRNAEIQKGAILFEGQDLLSAELRTLERIRGARISLIHQEPSLALHPTVRVGEQIEDVLRAHQSLSRRELRQKARQVLSEVFSADTERIANSYAHQLSGGQQQRILIAQAIVCGPSLLVADEPTASLDNPTQKDILSLFQTLREKFNLAQILITHNPALLAGVSHRVLVLYAGRVVEIGPTESILASPKHPYTRALLESMPVRNGELAAKRKSLLPVIPGETPNLAAVKNGCRFESRCVDRMDTCVQSEPQAVTLSEAHAVACFKHG
jgi:oligopeptide transport system ATP-binding protein